MNTTRQTKIQRVFCTVAVLVMAFSGTTTTRADAGTLQSQFLKNDSRAIAVMNGTSYDMNNYALICGSTTPGNSAEFGFKILNGIKQLGYINFLKCYTTNDKVAIKILNEYQSMNGLPQSDIVNSQVLLKLDQQLLAIESRDASLATSFGCYSQLKDGPPNDTSKNHLAFVLANAMSAFPSNLRINSTECFNRQSFQVATSGDILCEQGYWTEYDDNCMVRSSFDVQNLQSRDDYTETYTTIHEHAHRIDANGPVGRTTGGVDTTEFYNISYNYSDCVVETGWEMCKPRIDMNNQTQLKNNFFSYAPGWSSTQNPGYWSPYEDFAVSVEMYVMHGIEFRDYYTDKPILKQKYDWIKQHVFNNVEFNTGDANYKSYAPDLYNIGQGIVSAGGIGKLRANYVWDYQIAQLGSSTPPPPVAPPPPAQTPPPPTPSSTIRLVNDNGTYFLIKDGARQGITNPGMLFSYGFDFGDAQPASNSDKALPSAELLLPGDGSLVKSPASSTVWLISGGKKHGFTSENVFNGLGFKFTSVLTVTAPELDKLSHGPLLDNNTDKHADGVDINDNGTIYWLSGGKKYGYPSMAIYNSWHRDGDFSQVVPANTADKSLPFGGLVEMRMIN